MTKKEIKEYLENNFDILYWINDETAYVHYWDDDHGDFYLEENVIDLLDSLPPDCYSNKLHLYD